MNIETNQNTISTPRLAAAGAVLAALFCVLLYDSVFKLIPLGLNVPLYLLSFYVMLGAAFGRRLLAGLKRTAVHLAFIILLSLTFVLFNDPVLLTINAVLIILLTGEQVLLCLDKNRGGPYSMQMVGDSLAMWFGMPFGGLRGSFAQYKGSKNRFTGILIGVAVTIPVLLAVIPLLLSGDAVFNKFFLEVFGAIEWGDVVGNILVAIILFALFSGLFWSLSSRKKPAAPALYAAPKERPAFNLTASFILLSVLSLVLLLFCAIQFMYLFSGRVPDGLTYADYARSGFWQLLAVAVIVIALVFLLLRFGAPCSHAALCARRALMSLVLLCTIVLLVSSFARMTLYEQSFGFSQLRLFTQFFMAALFLSLVAGILRLWLSRIDLKKCACFCFLVCYMALAFFNLDAFIARENVKNQGAQVDVTYLTTLGPDALPYYVDLLDPESFETEIRPADPYNVRVDVGDRQYQYISGDELIVYRDEAVLTQAYRLRRIIRDLKVSDNWRYLNTGRGAAREALAAKPQLVENINKIKDAFTRG